MRFSFFFVVSIIINSLADAATDFTASLQSLLKDKRVADTTAWQTRNAVVKSIKPLFTAVYDEYQVVGAALLDESAQPVGEAYVLQDQLHPERLVNLNLDTSGRAYVVTVADNEEVHEVPMVDLNLPRCGYKDETDDTTHTADKTHTYEVAYGETDTDGSYVIDVLAVFSTAAAVAVQDMGLTLREYLYLQKTIVETAWVNSGITDVKLRMLDYSVWERDLAVTEANGKWLKSYARAKQALTGADLVAFFTNGSHKGPSDSSGYADVQDFYSLQLVNDLTAWRHELGHNAGLGHCAAAAAKDNLGHKHGIDVGDMGGTIMCGNSLPLFSNPAKEIGGKTAGDEETANAVRQWNDYKASMSGIKAALVPKANERAMDTITETVEFDTADGGDFSWTVKEGVTRFVFSVDSQTATPLTAFLDSACCLGVYWGTHEAAVSQQIVINEPHPGNWSARLTGTGPTEVTVEFY